MLSLLMNFASANSLSINEIVDAAQRGGAKEQLDAGLAYYQGWNGVKYDDDKAV